MAVAEWTPLVWALIGLAFIGAEFLGPGFVLFFFGVGGLLTAGASAIIPGLGGSLLLQIFVWLGTSVGTLFALRRRFKGVFGGRENRAPLEAEYAGKEATVVEAIDERHRGRVHFQGTDWDAISYAEKFVPGDSVQIVKQDNLTLVVSKRVADELADYEAAEQEKKE
jgi:membrane protein implicated in regulation of membrane protease activity